MAKYFRKNITLLPTPEGSMAYAFLDKLGHYQGRFLTQLINQYLSSNEIDTAEKLQNLSREDAQIMILSDSYNLNNKPVNNISSQVSANDFITMLGNIMMAGQNMNTMQNGVAPISSSPIEQLTETRVDSPRNYQNRDEGDNDIDNTVDDIDDGVNDDEDTESMDDIDLSMIEAFRQ